MSGSGTLKGTAITGNISIMNDGTTYANIGVTDYDVRKETGSISLSLTSDGWRSMGMSSSLSSTLATASLNIEKTKDQSVIDVNVSGASLVKMTASKSSAEKITIDSSASTQEMEDWVKTINFDELKSRLEKAGLPSSMLSTIFGSLASIR